MGGCTGSTRERSRNEGKKNKKRTKQAKRSRALDKHGWGEVSGSALGPGRGGRGTRHSEGPRVAVWIACWRTVRTCKCASAAARVREGAAAQCPPLDRNRTRRGGGGQGLRAAGRRRSISCLAHALAWSRLRVDGFGPNGAAACDSGPDAVGATSGWAVRARMTSRKC